MIGSPGFTVEPWGLTASGPDPSVLAQTESLFALSNGHIGWRGNLEEGEPRGMPGCYLNGFFEEYPLSHAEPGYGYPETGELLLNTVNGKLLRLLVDDEPLDVDEGTAQRHERRLDFRDGTLRRELEWTSPSGRTVRVRSARLVSLVERSLAAIEYEVEAVDACRVVVQSELLANEPLPFEHPDPTVAARLARPLVPVAHAADGTRAELVHRTAASGLMMAAGMDHHISAPAGAVVEAEGLPDLARTTIAVQLAAGERLRIVKFVAYCWSPSRGEAALRDEVDGVLSVARRSGWETLLERQRAFLDGFWRTADVEVEGDAELQQAVRFALFHVLQAGVRAEGHAIPGKGFTGPGYDGHAFWETETFVLPVLLATCPEAARDALRWRHSTLDEARRQACLLRQRGAAFPWRTVSGRESSGYWPASTAAFHINGDIADAVLRYVRATGDREFEERFGVELLVETARLWMALGYTGEDGGFHIDGVTGPDEYSAVVDDNLYTNLVAWQNLRGAAEAATKHPSRAEALGVGDAELAEWRRAADAMAVPYDAVREVHAQSRDFTRRERWDFEATSPDDYPLMEHFPYFELYRKQVVKQADLVLAMAQFPDAFSGEEKLRNLAYYEAITARDSSLSAATSAVLAAEVGDLRLASEYAAETALIDLDDIHDSVQDGLHLAALAGVWTAIVAGYAGMRHEPDGLRFAPRLPDGLTRLSFGLRLPGGALRVDVRPDTTTYAWNGDSPLVLRHFRDTAEVRPGEPVTLPTPPLRAPGIPIRQPPGRAPRTLISRNGD
ncbi:glycoside hydrolase family 65 protein [Naasia sp. SYSU D00948]|uniref:glycoside hydrolase family 65 protein n=1 Tax=Naasia sp. SYSU D00948 TaxID=2817379 RepID=UPI001B3165D1|nr:glycoside hydrolase family 65 protein [Naasia sp. SYSU D00948]